MSHGVSENVESGFDGQKTIFLLFPIYLLIYMVNIDATNKKNIAWHTGFVPITNVVIFSIHFEAPKLLPDCCAI